MWNCALKFSKQRGECSKPIFSNASVLYIYINCFTLVFHGFDFKTVL